MVEPLVRVSVAIATLANAYMPSLFVRRIYREQAADNFSIAPLVALQSISHAWLLYSVLTETWFPSFICYIPCEIAAACYNFIYWRYATERHHVTFILATTYLVLFSTTVYVVIGGLGYTDETREQVATHQGYVCDATMISVSLVMLKNLVSICKQRSVVSLDLPVLAVGSVNTCCWLAFGVVTSNWIVITPHILSMVLHAAAWVSYVAFRPRTSSIGKDEDDVAISLEYESLQSPLEAIDPPDK